MTNSSVLNIPTYTYIDYSKNEEVLPLEDSRVVRMLKDIYVLCKINKTEFIKLHNLATDVRQICKVNIKTLEKLMSRSAS